MDHHLTDIFSTCLTLKWKGVVKTREVASKRFVTPVGQRFIKLAKSPMSPPLAFPFMITSSGISLLSDKGKELSGAAINEIHCQG